MALQKVVLFTQNCILSVCQYICCGGLFDYILFCEFTGAEVNLDEKCMCVQQICVEFNFLNYVMHMHANIH